MATAEPLQSQPTAAYGTVRFHRFEKILRATRQKTATGTGSAEPDQKRRDGELVKTHADAQENFHEVKNPARIESVRHSSSNAANAAPAAARLSTTTIHKPRGSKGLCWRKISRTRRRMRARSTAEPVRADVITPRRGGSADPDNQPPSTMSRPCQDEPSRRTWSNSARRESRAALGSESAPMGPAKIGNPPLKRPCDARSGFPRLWAADACGRAGVGGTRWRAPLWSSCGHGSRAGVCACVWKAGKFFS